jgi:hypothetical protein
MPRKIKSEAQEELAQATENETGKETGENLAAETHLVGETQFISKREDGRGHKPKGFESDKRREVRQAAKSVELAIKGVPVADIARAVEVSPDVVKSTLKLFGPVFAAIPNVKEYQSARTVLFDAAEMVLLKSIVQEDAITKAPLNQRAYAFDILYKAGRLQANKSTENIAQLFYKRAA